MNQQTNTQPAHHNFIDWMKATGMFLIVFGHVVGPPFNQFTQPIYPKQLGVAFFLFITAWSLANDSRGRVRVLFNRLFPVYLFGICFALCLSVIFIFTKNDTNPSNYLPFFLGVNVLFNNFPANPTTWYIGTYLHFLLFWVFLLQGKTICKRHLALALLFEIIFRSLILASGKSMIAYMLLPNWLTVFLLGLFFSQKQDSSNTSRLKYLLPMWLGLFALSAYVTNSIGFDTSFPFRHFANDVTFSAVGQSTLISLIYCVHTMLFFAIARCLPPLRSVSFFARNTLVIFILHMPLIYAFSPVIYGLFESTFAKKLSLILLLYIGLASVSEIINKSLDIKAFREKLWTYLQMKLKIQ
jgi:hypothetical protein